MKEKGIKVLFSVFLFASLLMPFSVSAESVGGSSPIIGVNITYVGYDGEVVPYQTTVRFDTEQTMWRCTSSHSTMGCQVWESITSSGSNLDEITGTITTNVTSTYTYRLYQYEFIFDKSYVGSITFNGNHPGATTTTTYYVNGDRLVLTDVNLVTSFTIGSYSLTYAPLEVLDKMKQWNFPVESLSPVSYLYSYGYEEIDIYENSYWTYPIFQVPVNSVVASKWCSVGYQNYIDFIVIQSIGSMTMSNINTFYSFSNNATVESLTELSFSPLYSIYKVRLDVRTVSGFVTVTNLRAMNLCTIYFQPYWWKNISTDFALVYGLSNQLLDDLHIIAQGTQQSNNAASGLESSNSIMASDMNSMATIENGYSQDFNSQLQNIDFTNPIQQNQGILPAANFVISIFNGLINNNPFTVLIIIVCILLIGKKVIGK